MARDVVRAYYIFSVRVVFHRCYCSLIMLTDDFCCDFLYFLLLRASGLRNGLNIRTKIESTGSTLITTKKPERGSY